MPATMDSHTKEQHSPLLTKENSQPFQPQASQRFSLFAKELSYPQHLHLPHSWDRPPSDKLYIISYFFLSSSFGIQKTRQKTKNGLVYRQHISTVADSVVATKRLFCKAPRPRHPQPNPKSHKRQNPAISKFMRHCRLIFNSFQGLSPEFNLKELVGNSPFRQIPRLVGDRPFARHIRRLKASGKHQHSQCHFSFSHYRHPFFGGRMKPEPGIKPGGKSFSCTKTAETSTLWR